MSASQAKVAYLIAGQGAETPGMGLWLGDRLAPLMARVDHATGIDGMSALRRADPRLRDTAILQPTMTAIALTTLAYLREHGLEPHAIAGHSLGEVAAVAGAGCIDDARAVGIAARRGVLMAGAARRTPGGMIACASSEVPDGLELAAHNAPDVWVMTGDAQAIGAALARASATRLPVAGPWHSRHMQPARDALAQALGDVPFVAPTLPLIMNRDGRALDALDVRAALIDHLAGQLTRPIAWVATLRTLAAMGIDTFVTIGPGKVLRGLVRRVLGAVRILGSEDARDAALTLEALA